MRQIGVRELRQNASHWLREVKAGESLTVTEHGRPVALLVPAPPPDDPLERMRAAGQVRSARIPFSPLGPPLPPREGQPLLSTVLERMRADER